MEDEKPLLPPLPYEAVDDGRLSEGISKRIPERRPLQVDGDAAPVLVTRRVMRQVMRWIMRVMEVMRRVGSKR